MGSVSQSEPFHYDKVDGLYRLKCGDAILADMDRVAIAFAWAADGTTFRHKHGTPDSVLQWFRWAKARYESCNLQWIADELCILVTDSIDVAELNRIVGDGTYLATFLMEAGITPQDLKAIGPDASSSPCHSDRSLGAEVPAVSI